MKIGITLGDPAGIGPEIILKALPSIKDLRNVCIFGNAEVFEKTARDLGLMREYKIIEKTLIACVDEVRFHYGRPTRETGNAALQSINCALNYGVDVLVTPPIVKEVIRQRIPDFIGHTEHLARFFRTKNFAMLGLWRDKRIMLLTTHMPLRDIFKEITPTAIMRKLALLEWALRKYFRIEKPVIGVGSLNPHSFEFSTGEDEKIEKGIHRAQKKHIDAHGPYPSDSLYNRPYDGFLTMYHDQAMIFLKSKKNGLNITLGLPIIRLSPLYGAALDIAGENKAEVSGLITAVRCGVQLYRNVRRYEKKYE